MAGRIVALRLSRNALLGIALIATVAAVAPGSAQAASKKDLERAEARATEGKAYFKSKLYREAAEAFMDAYAIVKKPTLVYNAARAREESGEHRRAIALFTMYMGLPKVDAAGRKAAQGHIARLQAKVKAAEDKAKAEAAAKKAAADKAAADKAARDKAAADKAAADKAARDKAARDKAAAAAFPMYRFIGGGALGVFAIVAQVNALSLAEDAQLSNLDKGSTADEIKAARDAAPLWQGMAIGSGVLAAGLVGWAVYDWLIADKPRKNAENSGRTQLSLTPRRGGFAMSAKLRF